MKRKDRVVGATDLIANALQALARVNYDNHLQATNNIGAAAVALASAAELLGKAAMQKEETLS
jgi:hypothetical protein